MKIWGTKHCITSGVTEHDAIRLDRLTFQIQRTFRDSTYPSRVTEGKDWHRSKEAAVARADEVRTSRIASLRKQIAKLEKVDFTK